MSARVTALVWARYPNGAGEMLLALALADQCTDGGEYIAVDVARLAKKTRQADDTVRGQLRRMMADGWLEQMEGSKAYRIAPAWLSGQAPAPAGKPAPELKKIPRATRLTAEWILPEEFKTWALATFPAWTPEFVAAIAERFRDHWISASGQQASKVDWSGTWRNWCRKEPAVPPVATAAAVAGQWWTSSAAIDRKGAELQLTRIDGELWIQWRDRVFRAAGDGPWAKTLYKAPDPAGVNFTAVGALAGALAHLKGNPNAAGKVQ